MATAKLTKLWTAYFPNGDVIKQDKDDKYSKHDDNADWNPSAFRDIQEHPQKPYLFTLGDFGVDLMEGYFKTPQGCFYLEDDILTDRKLIYYREMERDNIEGEWHDARVIRYAMGYEGKNSEGKVEKKVIFIDG